MDSPGGSPLNEIEEKIREIERRRDESDDEFIGTYDQAGVELDETDSDSESAREDEELQAKLNKPPGEKEVVLDAYNCDLNMKIHVSGLVSEPVTDVGFAYMWAGVKATFGVNKGRVAFEVKILENLHVPQLPPEERNPHCVRVGWSVDSVSLALGESPCSFGYESTGKCSESLRFKSYGQNFGAGDVITCLADFVNGEIGFCKNGEYLGPAFDLNPDPSLKVHDFYFPHIVSKNCKFQCNFGKPNDPWFPLRDGFTFINEIPVEERQRGPIAPQSKKDCVVLMLIGLPGCGKSYWSERFAKEHPDERWNVLGTNHVLDQMKVDGLSRKRNFHGRWDVLIGSATKCLNKLLAIASRRKRNYIIDQTNVYAASRQRKMGIFKEFTRKAVIIIPNEQNYYSRCCRQAQEEGKVIPPEALLEMKANMSIPEEGEELFSEIQFLEEQRAEAQALVEHYNQEGQAYKPPPMKRFQKDTATGDNSDEEDARPRHATTGKDAYKYGVSGSPWTGGALRDNFKSKRSKKREKEKERVKRLREEQIQQRKAVLTGKAMAISGALAGVSQGLPVPPMPTAVASWPATGAPGFQHPQMPAFPPGALAPSGMPAPSAAAGSVNGWPQSSVPAGSTVRPATNSWTVGSSTSAAVSSFAYQGADWGTAQPIGPSAAPNAATSNVPVAQCAPQSLHPPTFSSMS